MRAGETVTRSPKEHAEYHRLDALGGVDMLQARYYRQRFARHVHDTFCIGVIDQGAQRFYRSGAEHGWAYRAIYPHPDLLNTILRELPEGKGFVPWFPDAVIHDPGLSEQLLLTFSMLAKEGNNLLKETLLLSSLTLLSVRYSRTRRPPQRLPAATERILRVKDFIESCPEADHTLTRLAELAGLSHWHFLRQFKAVTGLTPHAYLVQARLRKAKELLRQGFTILDTSMICGFTDQSHFHRHFKNSLGLTPGEFIKG